MSCFREKAGWLAYEPFRQFALPKLVPYYDINDRDSTKPSTAVFKRPDTGSDRSFELPTFVLDWPGGLNLKEGAEHWGDEIEARFLRYWDGVAGLDRHIRDDEAHPGRHTRYSIKDFFGESFFDKSHGNHRQLLPRELPPVVAYHLAVNRIVYGHEWKVPRERDAHGNTARPKTFRPVGGLPPARVDDVLDARFALEPKYEAALTYLKFLAESHHQHPFFTEFDATIQEDLSGIHNKAVKLYFKVLSDCLYDKAASWWARGNVKNHWWRLASYFFWVGKTGDTLTSNQEHADWTNKTFLSEMPDCHERLIIFEGNDWNRLISSRIRREILERTDALRKMTDDPE